MMLKIPYTSKLFKNIPLTLILVVPFVLQICVTVGVVGIFSFRNGQQAVGELATQLSAEISDRISVKLDNYLRVPPQINQTNVDAVKLGMLNLEDFQKVGALFWTQINLYAVGYINFAFDNQEFIGVERKDSGQVVINETTLARGITKTASFSVDQNGNRQELLEVIETDEDVREEGWYADAVKAGKPTWSQIYQWVDRPEVLSVSHSYPLYDRDRKIIGVLGVDFILTQLNSYLNELKSDKAGRIFIIERSGLVVGTSSGERTFSIVNGNPQRLNILNSGDPLSRATARYLISEFGGFTSIQDKENLEPNFEGGKHFIQVQSWRDRDGLDWLIVVVLPESSFMEQINNRQQITILFSLAALGFAILIGMMTARYITEPLLKLSGASQAIANGDLDSRVSVQGTSEVKVLSESFNRMAEMLTESFTRIAKANTELESRVQERTSELADSQLLLQRNNFLLQRREQQLRRQQKILINLTKNKALNLGDFIIAVQDITETASQTLDVERVSVWLFDNTKTRLHCLDLYIKSSNTHSETDFLGTDKFPSFFAALQKNRSLVIEDVDNEEILIELRPAYLNPLGILSLLISSFDIGGETIGLLMFEQIGVERFWLLEEISFASSLSELLSLGMEAQERRRAEDDLKVEKMRSERLLLNVLPKAIAERLKSSTIYTPTNIPIKRSSEILSTSTISKLKPSGTIVADTFEEVTVLFGDIVSFTEFASSVSANELVHMLNEIFSEFDRLVDFYGLEKIKTIGDSYMAVGGLPVPRSDHAEAIASMALDMQHSISKFIRPDGSPFTLRIGIHTGQAVAGVIGKKKFIYDLWGDTVNIASRMESHGVAGCIQVTDVTYQVLKDKFHFDPQRKIEIKGKGEMITYFLVGKL
ncbi:adenylate/guanylate cyclase domain-containing protein [Pseudanabaena galeata UHCC 0370]|uniref:Adenylate/guanylate cyclase domain-containing protein n=1 Tax=Pseudanabaena galeata UHCC 0370 TaxID=3110310 RepID=A0ABU5TGK7_9CYAN|nr:adenylate/guanylate cyclase domain-containing protein [Pseudanabaena galeata]MEA5477360.1 adenylate/guanylate cyclase domain-containing protein [Pseudanabaena galeata UHCC 0370]